MVSYVICTTIALALGLVLATIIIGLIMTTKLYRKIAMRITRSILLSDDYDSIIKEFVEKTVQIAVNPTVDIKVEGIDNGDEA